MKLIKIDGYWIVVKRDTKINPKELFIHTLAKGVHINNDITHIEHENYSKLLASQNPTHNLPNIIFSDEVAKELEDNKEKRFTEKEIIEAWEAGQQNKDLPSFIRSLTKEEYDDVEIKKEYLSNSGEWKDVLLPSEWEIDTQIRPKITNNSITITKIIK